MFIAVALTLAVVMLVGANYLVRKNRKPTASAVAVCFVSSGLPFFCVLGVYVTPLFAQGLLLFLALPLAAIPRRGPKVYHVASALLAAVAWLVALGDALPKQLQYAEWRAANPFESMEQRAPVPIPLRAEVQADQPPSWDVESDLEQRPRWQGRSHSLRTIHEGQQWLFERAMGFGAARMIRVAPNAEHFAPDTTPPVPQPEGYDPNAVSLGDEMPADPQRPFAKLHANSLLDFANPDGWGYVKSRREVAGFRPHRFSQVPEPAERYSVRRVELIGLLRHEKPAVYVSEHLPRMDELKDAATRPPDSFEAEALTTIRGGHDLFARGSEDDVRMVGAIRGVTQCVECHGGGRGDLLGAFSYRLRREGGR